MRLTDALTPGDLRTRFRSIGRAEPTAGTRVELEPSDDVELCVVVLSGTVSLEGRDARVALAAASVALCPPGVVDSVVGASSGPAAVLVAAARTAPHDKPSRVETDVAKAHLDRSRLSPFEAHGGIGAIGFRTLFDQRDSAWHSIDHVLLPPGTSVGFHRNHDVEEVFVVLRGAGRMRIEDRKMDVVEGDCIPNPPGGAHGIANPGPAPLELLNLSVSESGGPGVVTDLGDDLRDLLEEDNTRHR